MNLYLYLCPSSAHPPGVLKGLIFGSLRRYWRQNSDIKDYKHIRPTESSTFWQELSPFMVDFNNLSVEERKRKYHYPTSVKLKKIVLL